LRKLRTVSVGDLTDSLRLTREQEYELLRRMARGGLIARVRPGLYLLPQQLPLGGSWSPDEIRAINTLMGDRKGRYQISGPNAFNRYGFDEQVPNRVVAYNNRISGERRIGTVALTLIKVSDERLGATETFTTTEGETAVYSSRARTLLDAVYDWARFDSLPRAYGWIRQELLAKRVSASELAELTVRYGDMGTIRRMGLVLEREGVRETLLRKLEKEIRPATSLIPWIPRRPKLGAVNRRWGVTENDKRART